jgi:hypothetical protein
MLTRKACERLITLALAAAGLLAGPLATQALADTKIVHGSICRNDLSTEGSMIFSPSGFTNQQSVSTTVFCPLQRDNTTATTNALSGIEISVSSSSVRCSAKATSESSIAVNTVSGSLPSGGIIRFSTGLTGFARGSLVVECTLPPATTVHSIYYNEP